VSWIDRQCGSISARIDGIRGENHRRRRSVHVRRDVRRGDTRMRGHRRRYWVGRNATCSQVGRNAVLLLLLNVVLYKGMGRYV